MNSMMEMELLAWSQETQGHTHFQKGNCTEKVVENSK